ncbi:hypothetical protein [Methylocystis echinoides]|uniref:hypothetical protein n=1 Tax=Methylocystis echinoides TaxID=29468 RepID=UPI0034140138
MSSAWPKWRKPLALGLLLAVGVADAATAQFFFRPYFHSWRYDFPPDEDDLPRYGSRRAVARILAGAGYELVGPLGRRGDQIVATGVSRRAGEARFIIDPYEGEIVRATRLGPAAEGRRSDEERLGPADGSRPPPAREGRAVETPRRAARAAPQPLVEKAPPGRSEAVAPSPNRAMPGPAKPLEAEKPLEAANPPEPSKPADVAKPVEIQPPPPGQTTKSQDEAPQKPAEAAKAEARPAAPATTQKAAPTRPVAARSTGSSHRAIVPPKQAEGTTAVTPSAPSTSTAPAASAQTPASVAMPKSAQ